MTAARIADGMSPTAMGSTKRVNSYQIRKLLNSNPRIIIVKFTFQL
jgi:hypothetical protein